MRILRIRRGYTTNSSGANEWVPPPDAKYNQPQPGKASGAETARTQQTGEALVVWSANTKQLTMRATDARTEHKAGPSQPTSNAFWTGRMPGNLGLMASLLGAVCLLFIVNGVARRALGKKR